MGFTWVFKREIIRLIIRLIKKDIIKVFHRLIKELFKIDLEEAIDSLLLKIDNRFIFNEENCSSEYPFKYLNLEEEKIGEHQIRCSCRKERVI